MRVVRAEAVPYRTVLADAFGGGAAGRWTERRGLLFRVESDSGALGQGEAAPLPGYSPDTCDQAEQELHAAARSAPEWEIDTCLPAAPQLGRIVRRLGTPCPSARAAVETALLDLAGQHLQAPVSWLLCGRAKGAPRPAAAVVAADESAAVSAARAWDQGYRTFKLKVGAPGAFDAELAALRELREGLPEVRLRCDANGAFGGGLAEAVLPRLGALNLELLEQPVPARELESLRVPGGSPPLAADESLQDRQRARRIADGTLPGIAALVLKPSAIGGPLACWELALRARRSGLAVVVSHLLEGPVGYAACAELALALPEDGPACGLAPHPALRAWGEAARPRQAGGACVRPSSAPGLGLPLVEPVG